MFEKPIPQTVLKNLQLYFFSVKILIKIFQNVQIQLNG
jgi:hypothetical protein